MTRFRIKYVELLSKRDQIEIRQSFTTGAESMIQILPVCDECLDGALNVHGSTSTFHMVRNAWSVLLCAALSSGQPRKTPCLLKLNLPETALLLAAERPEYGHRGDVRDVQHRNESAGPTRRLAVPCTSGSSAGSIIRPVHSPTICRAPH